IYQSISVVSFTLHVSLLIPTTAFSLANVGYLSLWVTPSALALTIIYHIVLIVKHNRRPASRVQHDVLWEATPAIVCGFLLAAAWTAGAIMSTLMAAFIYNDPDGPGSQYSPIGILEVIFTWASAGVMWSLAGVATHLRRQGPHKGQRLPLV
ncbi:hypothetical protein DL96DRAFT_1590476, partial [Flagelloscypha sp. PMI_526]